jgi:hypothetical protein
MSERHWNGLAAVMTSAARMLMVNDSVVHEIEQTALHAPEFVGRLLERLNGDLGNLPKAIEALGKRDRAPLRASCFSGSLRRARLMAMAGAVPAPLQATTSGAPWQSMCHIASSSRPI